MPVNLKQLAELLGLSQTTVSRALNGYPRSMRKRGRGCWRRLARRRVQPNRAAQRLATGKAYSIGSSCRSHRESIRNIHFGEFLAGLAEEAVDDDFHFVLNPQCARRREATFRRLAASGNVDAVFTAYMRRERSPHRDAEGSFHSLRGAWPLHAVPGTIPSSTDNTGAFYDAARLLIQLGHNRIALINGPEHSPSPSAGKRGWCARLAEKGLNLTIALVLTLR